MPNHHEEHDHLLIWLFIIMIGVGTCTPPYAQKDETDAKINRLERRIEAVRKKVDGLEKEEDDVTTQRD